jgi:hypothetical protein
MQICQKRNPPPVLRVSDPRQEIPQRLDALEESVCGCMRSDNLVNFVAECIEFAISRGCSDHIIRPRADKASGFVGDLQCSLCGTPPGARRDDPHILRTRSEDGCEPGGSDASIQQPGEGRTKLRQS